MELGEGRGSQLGEEDSPYIVREKIQPLPTYSARDMRYYRITKRHYRITKRHYRTGLRYYRREVQYYRSRGMSQVRPCSTWQRAVELSERYYRGPLRYYRKAGLILGREGTD